MWASTGSLVKHFPGLGISRRVSGPFRKAMRIGKRSEARELVDMGAGFDCNGDLLKRSGNTMLHLAVREGLIELTLHLIGLGVDVNAIH